MGSGQIAGFGFWEGNKNGTIVLEFSQDSDELSDVRPHGRAIVADCRCACREMAIHDVEQDPRGTGELHDDATWSEGVVQHGDFLEVEDQAMLVDDALGWAGRAA